MHRAYHGSQHGFHKTLTKNYLFAGSDAGGRAAAILYSVVGTCRRLGIDPFAYLRGVLARLPALAAAQLDDILPGRWAAAPG
jgi:hypothetical protein